MTNVDQTECYTDPKGRDYRGRVFQTVSGKPCREWSSQEPNSHSYTPERYLHLGFGEHNYCRNSFGSENKPWCFTSDPKTTSETCDVGPPSQSCRGTYVKCRGNKDWKRLLDVCRNWYCTTNQKLACCVLFLKIIIIFMKK